MTEHRNFLRLMRGEAITRPRKLVWLLQDQSIARLQKQFTSQPPRITTLEFLSAASHRLSLPEVHPHASDDEDDDLASLENETPSILGSIIIPGETY